MVLQQEMAFIVFAKGNKLLHTLITIEKRNPVSFCTGSFSCSAGV